MAPLVKEFHIHHMVEEGGQVCVLYDFEMNTPLGRISTADWFRIEDGNNKELRIYFDVGPMQQMQGDG